MSRLALVTGVSGFAGRELARSLLAEGWSVAGTVHSRSSDVAGVEERRVDIEDRERLQSLVEELEPDVVFHLAAIVDTVETPDVGRLYAVNTLGTVAVAEALQAAGSEARLFYSSSAFVYGATGPERHPVREDQPLAPVTPYGTSKAAGELVVHQHARQTGREVVVARAFQHTGPGHVGAYALADWARQLAEIELENRPGVIRCGNIEVERDYLDVRDVAAAYVAGAARGRAGETYNVASGVPRTMRSLLEGLIEAFGVAVEIEVDEQRLRGGIDQPAFYGDAEKLRAHTGWAPARPIEGTLADLASFWRERVASERSRGRTT